MTTTSSSPSLLSLLVMCIGPIIGVFIIWQVIKLLRMEYWLRVPRQSRLKQWGQYGILFILFIIVSNLASYMLGSDSQSQSYGLIIALNVIVWTLFLFGLVVVFMQSWIASEWVRWTAENYPQQHREILLFASRGKERRKWRQNKEFENFRKWVQDFVQQSFEGTASVQGMQKEIPVQSASKAEILLGKLPLIIIGGFSVLIIGAVIWIGLGSSFYFFKTVNSEEIGVQFENGSIKAIVGPGTYSDIGRFVYLEPISCAAIPLTVTDPDVFTTERDVIALTVTGSVFRLCDDQAILRDLWGHYKNIFVDDDEARIRMIMLTRQAMKVCVGNYKFAKDIFEDDATGLRNCIEGELNTLAKRFGLRVENIVISEIK